MMQWMGIVAMSVACCVGYGIIQDLITARICVEYFTIGHPPVFPTLDPTLLGIGWGVIATWWVGAILGIPLSLAARFGSAPKRTTHQLIRPMLIILLCSAIFAFLIGCVGFVAAKNGWVFLIGDISERVPVDRHVLFLTNLWAHSASYFSGVVGSIILIVQTWRTRQSSISQKKTEPSDAHQALGHPF